MAQAQCDDFLRARAVVTVRTDRCLRAADRAVGVADLAACVLIRADEVHVGALGQRVIGAQRSLVIGRRRIAARLRVAIAETQQQHRRGLIVQEALADVVLLGRAERRKAVRLVLRVAVARAVAGDPAILLADEPTGNLDSQNSESVMNLLKELHQGGATICMVTHDARYAHQADRTIDLFDGKIIETGIAAAV